MYINNKTVTFIHPIIIRTLQTRNKIYLYKYLSTRKGTPDILPLDGLSKALPIGRLCNISNACPKIMVNLRIWQHLYQNSKSAQSYLRPLKPMDAFDNENIGCVVIFASSGAIQLSCYIENVQWMHDYCDNFGVSMQDIILKKSTIRILLQ